MKKLSQKKLSLAEKISKYEKLTFANGAYDVFSRE